MLIIFCEECGSRNVIGDRELGRIEERPVPCEVCGFLLSAEHIVNHTGGKKVIDTSSYRLLIIDDDTGHLELLKASLGKEYTVLTAPSGEDGLATARAEQPDLILLDVNMPGLDGYQTCERLKGDNTTRHIPIIFVTAKTDKDDEYRGLSLGAVDYIFKPFNQKILTAKIAAHMRFNAMRNDLRRQIAEHENTIRTLKREMLAADPGPAGAQEDEPDGKGAGLREFLGTSLGELNEAVSTLLITSDAMANRCPDDPQMKKLNEIISDASRKLTTLFTNLKKLTKED